MCVLWEGEGGEGTHHATGYTAEEGGGAGIAGVEFCFGGDEEEDGAFGGSFYPGLRISLLATHFTPEDGEWKAHTQGIRPW